MHVLIVATRNTHKLSELQQILGKQLALLIPLDEAFELPPETGASFAENALIKARASRELSQWESIADDSGIEAAALGGQPGVRSARYAGEGATDEQNLSALLGELENEEDRRVAYVCVIAFVALNGEEHLFEGRCEGTLAREPRGSGGFGYDPAFVPTDTGPDDPRTMAELTPEEKHAISHRGRAARALAQHLSGRPEAHRS